MTSRNTNWKNKPFLLSPAGKDYLWGGDRLNTDFHKKIDMTPLAETWECSAHPDGTPRKLLDVSKLNGLGWHYKTELEEGIRLTYEDFLHNPMRAER